MIKKLLKYIDRLFETKAWKAIAIVLYLLLLYWILKFSFLVNQSVQFALQLGNEHQPKIVRELQDAYNEGVISVTIIVFLAIAALFELYRKSKINNEFRLLAKTMLDFANGNLSERYNQEIIGETKVIGRAFNQMANSLQALIEELQDTEVQRRDFQANVAHDLAGPLTSLSGYLETIAKTSFALNAPENAKFLDIIRKNIASLNKLVADLAELSSTTISKEQLNKEFFSLYSLTYDVVARYAKVADDKQIKFFIPTNNSECMVNADAHLIERVISNLIENAIRYTPNGGQIKVAFEEGQDFVSLAIEDSGIGIPEDKLPFVFERFYQASPKIKSINNKEVKARSNGIGLAIVKSIIEAHNGKIDIHSIPNSGTCITISLNS
jgi:signal transduction histidine kinase